MKKLAPIWLACLLLTAPAVAQDVQICQGGTPDNAAIVTLASQELKHHLERFYPLAAAIVPGTRPRVKGQLQFIVGQGPHDSPPLGAGEFAITIQNETVWLWGEDLQRTPSGADGAIGFDSRNSRKGTLHSVYQFLEQFCGIRWLLPGEQWTVRKDTAVAIQLPKEYQKVYSWRFDRVHFDLYGYGEARLPHANQEITRYYLRKRAHFNVGRSYSFVHAWGELIGRNRHFTEHPEYYPLINGRRKPFEEGRDKGTQVCTSNSAVVELFAAAIVERFRRTGEEIISISPNDGGGFCECEPCRALDRPELYNADETSDLPDGQRPGLNDRVVHFVNRVAAIVKKDCPSVKLGLLLYSYYVLPPKSLGRIEDNVIGQYCVDPAYFNDDAYRQKVMTRLQGWLDRGIGGMYVHTYTGAYYWNQAVHLHPRTIAAFIRQLDMFSGVRGLTIETSADFATNGLNHHVYFELLNDSSRDIDAVLEEYCALAFGPGADAMKNFIELAESTFMRRDSRPWRHYCEVVRWYDDEFFHRAYRLLHDAQRQVIDADPLYRQRIELIAQGLDHTRNLVEFLQSAAALRQMGIPFGLTHLETSRYAAPFRVDPQDRLLRDALITRAMQSYARLRSFALPRAGSPYFNARAMLVLDAIDRWGETIDMLEILRGKKDLRLLSGGYPFRIDPTKVGLEQGWHQPLCNDADWKELRLDDPWESQGFGEGGEGGYNGIAWYRIRFDAPADHTGSRVQLYLGAVDESCWIYLNGHLVGQYIFDAVHEPDGWKKTRIIELTAHVRFGQPNLIAVRVEDNAGMGGIWKGAYITYE